MKNKKNNKKRKSHKTILPLIIAGTIISILYFIIIVVIVFINIVSWLKIALIITDTVLVGIMIQTLVDRIVELTDDNQKHLYSK